MHKGVIVKVVNPESLFHGVEGTVEQVRLPPGPIGVRMKKGFALVWFRPDELEEIQGTEKMRIRGVLSISN